jgi:putative DNA primase/helicase
MSVLTRKFLPVSTQNIPDELKALQQWVLWRGVERDGRWTKIPYSVTGDKASATDGATWRDFDNASESYKNGSFDGIGFVFAQGSGLTGVDLDDCVLSDGGLEPKAAAIVNALGSYTEYSVSGSGLHIIVRASLEKGVRTSARSRIDIPVEIYPHGKYFTMTGSVYSSMKEIAEGQSVIDYLCSVVSPPAASNKPKEKKPKREYLDNDELIKRAMNAKDGDKFKRLWSGDTSEYGGDHSRADAALLKLLVYWTYEDLERTDLLFRQSGLYREDKWDKRPDYRKRTFDFILGARKELS